MKIQVLGSGCPTCQKLYDLVQEAVKELNLDEEVKYIKGQEGIQKMIGMGIVSSPALVIDGELKMTGIEDLEKIKKIINES